MPDSEATVQYAAKAKMQKGQRTSEGVSSYREVRKAHAVQKCSVNYS
jgi:hypothetical protein